MKENEYECEMCGGTFESAWSYEEACTEAKENFGKHPDEWKDGKATVCDDCYQEINPKNHPEEVERVKKFL